jgi:hypothetical protein
MSIIVPIDSEKIVEILFDNSEQLSNDIYVDLMALMKRYHDTEDNEEHIKAYLESKKNVIDSKVLERIKKYIAKEPCCRCRFRINVSRNDFCIFIAVLVFLIFIGGMLYFMATSYLYGKATSIPPPSTRPV